MHRKKALLLYFFGLVALLLAYLIPRLILAFDHKSSTKNELQKLVYEKEAHLSTELIALQKHKNPSELFQTKDKWEKEFSNGYSYFVFYKDKLLFWSEDATSINKQALLNERNVYQSSNALHQKLLIKHNDSAYVGLVLLQHRYPYKNQYLNNHLQKDLQRENIDHLSEVKKQATFSIQNIAGDPLFNIEFKTQPSFRLSSILSLLLLVFSAGLLLYASRLLWKKQALIVTLNILALRLILYWKLPFSLASLPLFQADYFAISTYIPSLGDLLLNVLFLLFITQQLATLLSRSASGLLVILCFILSLLESILTIHLIDLSISRSQINFNLNYLFELNLLSFIGFGVFILFMLCTLFLHYSSLKAIRRIYGSRLSKILSISLALSVLLFTYFIENHDHWIHAWIGIATLLFLIELSRKKKSAVFLFMILLLSNGAIVSYSISSTIEKNESTQQQIMIQKLAEERDPIAEYLFSELQNDIRSDSLVLKSANKYWEKKEEIDQHLISNYFSAYWERYLIEFTICEKQDSLLIQESNLLTSCFDYFQSRIRQEGDMVSSNNLFQLRNFAGRIDYIGEVEIPTDSNRYRLYVELSTSNLKENEGYPELLLDEKTHSNSFDLSNYSYAVYNQGELVYKNGTYNYSTELKLRELAPYNFYQYQTTSFQHLVFQKDKNVTILLSKKSYTFFDFITSLAYLSVLFALLFVSACILFPEFPFHFQLKLNDFSIKVQLFLVSSLLCSLVLLAWATTYYIQQQYQEKNSKNLEEKLRSVILELESKIGREESLYTDFQPLVNDYLIKFSNVFYTDINLYGLDGQLFSTSRSEVFSKGLKSKRMNPVAYKEMLLEHKAQWIQEEKIGKMEYLSAYIPFRNYNNQVLGYLNLPYFQKQGELENEISTFLVSTLNIYVGIFALALLISVLLINQLSKPLLLIRQQIARLKLGSSIELIDWNSNDEIGALVKEYNRIAVELEESARQLAKSEREVAWREMAKQVAHEIKNPLTPMKLSIQHLQRAAQNKNDQFDELVDRTTQTLVEQIETLANIASAFSSFAKLPERNLELVDLIAILKTAVDLYKDFPVSLQLPANYDAIRIEADRDQLLRLFNNLIKNAIQATEGTKDPEVKVRLELNDSYYKILVKDNGSGIPPGQQSRIFEPNFTTKTSGTGLGLAMSKSIVEQMQGNISFHSSIESGTTFTVELPRA
jgi:signal transduction histidine kinase